MDLNEYVKNIEGQYNYLVSEVVEAVYKHYRKWTDYIMRQVRGKDLRSAIELGGGELDKYIAFKDFAMQVTEYTYKNLKPELIWGEIGSETYQTMEAILDITKEYFGDYWEVRKVQATRWLDFAALKQSIFQYFDQESPAVKVFNEFPRFALQKVLAEVQNTLFLGGDVFALANKVEEHLGVSMVRSARIARTETMRILRDTMRQEMSQFFDLYEYMWVSALDERTCAICYFMHGKKFGMMTAVADHPNGRCAIVPVLPPSYMPLEEQTLEPGEEAFKKLPAQLQMEKLGKRRYELWKSGMPFDSLFEKTVDPVYGLQFRFAPMGQIEDMARRLGISLPTQAPKQIVEKVVEGFDLNQLDLYSQEFYLKLDKKYRDLFAEYYSEYNSPTWAMAKVRSELEAMRLAGDKKAAELLDLLNRNPDYVHKLMRPIEGEVREEIKNCSKIWDLDGIFARFPKRDLRQELGSEILGRDLTLFQPITSSEAGRVKDSICKTLSQLSGLDYEDVNRLIKSWAFTSNDDSFLSLSMQYFASERFGVPLSDWQREKWRLAYNRVKEYFERSGGSFWSFREDFREIFPTYLEEIFMKSHSFDEFLEYHRKNVYSFLDAMYSHTQKMFKDYGIEEVTLVRGIDISPAPKHGSFYNMKGNAMESWTIKPEISSRFGSVFFMAKVPVERIIGSCVTGYGCFDELEYVVLGGFGDDVVLVWRRY